MKSVLGDDSEEKQSGILVIAPLLELGLSLMSLLNSLNRHFSILKSGDAVLEVVLRIK